MHAAAAYGFAEPQLELTARNGNIYLLWTSPPRAEPCDALLCFQAGNHHSVREVSVA